LLAGRGASGARARSLLSGALRPLRGPSDPLSQAATDRRRAQSRDLRGRARPRRRRPRTARARLTMQALDDVRILDFMWGPPGPSAPRMLADHGATVVRIESTRRIDTARTLAPFHGGRPGAERSALFHNTNASKRMMTLAPTHPAGRAVVLDLVRWADVVTESFKPGVMRGWGLDYATLRAVKPDVIMLSTCLMGQTGPWATFAGYGNLAAAISGFSNLGGWPDRPPAGPFSAHTDYVSSRFIHV